MRTWSTLVALVAVTSSFIDAAPAYADRRGEVTSRPCPYSCRTQGIPKKDCKDWRQGNVCFIEDLRRPPAAPSSGPPPSGGYTPPSSYQPPPYQPPAPAYHGSGECEGLDRRDIPEPRVDIERVGGTGNIFGDKYKVRGSVEGVCVAEAGLFEDGRKVQDIPIVTKRSFQRFEFEFKTRLSKDPEIRVYNTAGDRDIAPVSPEGDRRDRDDDRDDRDGGYGGGYYRR